MADIRKVLIFFFFCFLSVYSFSQDEREMFRGGMFIHSGFVQNKINYPSVSDGVSGIGGKLTFRAGNHFRFGGEGYVSSFNYKNNDGKYELGWGGLLTEFQFNDNKIAPVIGVTIGGGKVSDLYIISGNFTDNFTDEAIYKVYSSLIVAPQFSLEIRMTSHINLAAKIDYLLYPGIGYPNYVARGPRFYLGVLFMR